MSSISDLFSAAVELHQNGRLQEARDLYERIVRHDPTNAAALNLLGVVAYQSGQHADAIGYYQRAIVADPLQPLVFANQAEAHRALGQLAEGIDCYRQAVRLQPDGFDVHNNLGTLLQLTGQLDAATASYEQARRIDPQRAEAHFNLGTVYERQGRLAAAAQSYLQVLERQSNHLRTIAALGNIESQQNNFSAAQTWYERAIALDSGVAALHYRLGNAHQEQEQFAAAIACYRRALELEPNYAEAHYNLGNTFRKQQRYNDALVALERAVQLRPDFAAAQNNLGVVYQQLARLPEAQVCYERATGLEPDNASYHFNLGNALQVQGDPLAAIACFDRALAADPSYRPAASGRGMALLSLGRFAEGWADYEFRVGSTHSDTLSFSQPLWDGSPLGVRTLLIHCEQGLGDTLQFVRYVKLAAERVRRIIVAAPPALLPLLAQSGFTGLVSIRDPLPSFDTHAPLLSLPRIFRTELDTVPGGVPYLTADPARIEKWRDVLGKVAGLKIGIAWQGQPGVFGDCLRSIPLEAFAPLAKVPGTRFISLQKGAGAEQIAGLAGRFEVIDLGASLDAVGGAFMDTAAVMQHLDLIISCDTAIAHLAGALGIRVWVALSVGADWRWLRNRTDSPWYPTMRLFRQSNLGDWSPVFEQMASALRTERSAG